MEDKTKDEQERLEDMERGKKVFKGLGIIILILIIAFIGVKVYKYYHPLPLQKEFPGVVSITTETSPVLSKSLGYKSEKYTLILYNKITPKEIFGILKILAKSGGQQPITFKKSVDSTEGYTTTNQPGYKTNVVYYGGFLKGGRFLNGGILGNTPGQYTLQMLTNGKIIKIPTGEPWPSNTMGNQEFKKTMKNLMR